MPRSILDLGILTPPLDVHYTTLTIPTIIYHVYMHIATILHSTYRTGTGTVNGPGVLQSGRSVSRGSEGDIAIDCILTYLIRAVP